jgi:AcrR family transcriptional regulator
MNNARQSPESRPYEQLRPSRRGRSREEVLQHQRARLFEAMIGSVAEQGYAATTVTQLRARAGVSKRTIYDHFPSKEAYFLATYDLVVYEFVKEIAGAYETSGQWDERTLRSLLALVRTVQERRDAARLVLIEGLGAGRAAIELSEQASRMFERMVCICLGDAPRATALDPLIAKGIVGGITAALRHQIIHADLECSPELAADMLRWMASYQGSSQPAVSREPVGFPAPRLSSPTRPNATEDERTKMLASALRVAARVGSANLTVAHIIEDAGCSDQAFFELFDNCEQCFFEAVEHGLITLHKRIVRASADARDWVASVREGVRVLMAELAANPTFARAACIEVFNLGRDGALYGVSMPERFSALLADSLSPAVAGELSSRMIAGAVWEVIRSSVARDETWRLPELKDLAAYLVLAPSIGADDALSLLSLGHREQRASSADHEPYLQLSAPGRR